LKQELELLNYLGTNKKEQVSYLTKQQAEMIKTRSTK